MDSSNDALRKQKKLGISKLYKPNKDRQETWTGMILWNAVLSYCVYWLGLQAVSLLCILIIIIINGNRPGKLTNVWKCS